MGKISILPAEIISDILSRLPVESVLECKLVCKPWRNLVYHPCFSQLHLLHLHDHIPGKLSLVFIRMIYRGPNLLSFFEYNDDDEQTPLNKITTKINLSPLFRGYCINGSSYGLICVIGFNAEFFICNPVTKEFVILPEVNNILLPNGKTAFQCVLSGFGYLPLSNEYKAVRIIDLGENTDIEHVVEVYTLGSGIGWRNLGKYKLDVCLYNICQFDGVFASGILHWVTEDRYIVAFDLADEKFCEIPPLPIPHDYDSFPWFSLGLLGGFMYCSKHEMHVEADEMPVEIHEMSVETSGTWVLKKNKGNCSMKDSEEYQSWSWSKEFNATDFHLLALIKSGDVLFHNGTGLFALMKSGALLFSSNGTGLFSYDRNSSCSKMLVNYDQPIKRAIPYVKTLVSLKALGEEDTKTMDQRE